VIEWVREYAQKHTASQTVITFKLEYFNTSSGKCFVEILKILDKVAENGHQVFLKWYYEEDDEDMNISGDDMQASIKYIQMEKIPYMTN
jgi:SiaC family regulatory phosphoprotein